MFSEKHLIYNTPDKDFNDSNSDILDGILNSSLNIKEALQAQQKQKELQIEINQISKDLHSQLNLSVNNTNLFIDKGRANLLLQTLQNQNLNEATLQQVKSEIASRQSNIHSFVQALNTDNFSDLPTIKTSKLDITSPHYLQQFRELDTPQQESVIKELQTQVQELNLQLEEFLNISGNKKNSVELKSFKKLSKQDRATHLEEYTKTTTSFKELLNNINLPQKEFKEKLKFFQDQGLQGKKLLLKQLQESLNFSVEENKEFQTISAKRRNKYPNFLFVSHSEKQDILLSIRKQIKYEYLKKLRGHKFYNSATFADIEQLESTFHANNGNFDIALGEVCLTWLDSTMIQINHLYQQTKKFPQIVLQHFGWEQLGYFERKKLFEQRTLETYSNSIEHIQLDNKYIEKLNKFSSTKPINLLTRKSVKSYQKWFQKLTLQQKRDIVNSSNHNLKLDHLELTKSEREKLNVTFLSFPKQVITEYYNQYLEADFKERQKIVSYLGTELPLTKNTFNKQLKFLLKNKLIPQKHNKKYSKHFSSLNLKQQQHFLQLWQSDLKERQSVVETFETELLPILPEEKLKLISTQFYNSTLDKRHKLIQKLKTEYSYTTQAEEELNNAKIKLKKEENLVQKKEQKKASDLNTATSSDSNSPASKPELQEEKNTKKQERSLNNILDSESIIDKYFIQVAENFEQQGDFINALKFYQEALKLEVKIPKSQKEFLLERIEIIEKQEELIEENISQFSLLEDSLEAKKEQEEEAENSNQHKLESTIETKEQESINPQLSFLIYSELEDFLKNNSPIQKDLQQLSLLTKLCTLQENNEQYNTTTHSSLSAASELNQTLNSESQELKNLNQLLLEYTNSSTSLYKEKEKDQSIQLTKTEELIFNTDDLTSELKSTHWNNYLNTISSFPKEVNYDPRFKLISKTSNQRVSAAQFKEQFITEKTETIQNILTEHLINKLQLKNTPTLKIQIENIVKTYTY